MATQPQALQRKPARSVHCYCGHRATDHTEEGCYICGSGKEGCRHFHPRPCRCGHQFEEHRDGKRCLPGCECKAFQESNAPAFLLRRGLCNGFETVDIPKAQLEALMRPEMDMTTRVWACGMLFSMGQRSRVARMFVPELEGPRKHKNLQPGDMVEVLNKYEKPGPGRASHQNVRRALREVQRIGMGRVGYELDAQRRPIKKKGHLILAFYLKPRPVKSVLPPAEDEDLAITPDWHGPVSDTQNSNLRDEVIVAVKRVVNKTLLRVLRTEVQKRLQAESDLTITPDWQMVLDEMHQQLEMPVWSACQKLLVAVCADSQPACNKEDRVLIEKSSSSQPVAAEPTAPTTTREPDPITQALNAYTPTDPDAVALLRQRVMAVAPDATETEMVYAIHQKGSLSQKKDNPTGFLLTAVPNLFRGAAPWRAKLKADIERAEAYQQRQAAEQEACRQEIVNEYRERLNNPGERDEALKEVAELQLWDYLAELQPDLIRLGYTPPGDEADGPPKARTAGGGGQ